MKKKEIAKLNNEKIYEIYLENEEYKITLLNYACVIKNFIYKKIDQDIVYSYDFFEKYVNDTAYVGKVVAPTAGRIENAKYSINGIEYLLDKNDGENNLHSGYDSLSYKVFDFKEIKNGVEFYKTYYLDKQDKKVKIDIVVQCILENDGLLIKNYATTNDEAFINITNHSYFNLDSSETIEDHMLKMNSLYVYEIKENGIASSFEKNVKDTAFDFIKYTRIGDNLKKGKNKEFLKTKGIDNPFLINKKYKEEKLKDKKMEKAVEIYSKKNNLKLSIYTTEKTFVCYSGNYLYPKYRAIAFETQNHPNAINFEDNKEYISSRIKPYYSSTKYVVEIKE